MLHQLALELPHSSSHRVIFADELVRLNVSTTQKTWSFTVQKPFDYPEMWKIKVVRCLLLATAIVFMLVDTSLAVSECPEGFTFLESVSGCYKLLLSNLDWSSAGQQCRTLHDDAHLVVIGDAAEQHALSEFFERNVQATSVCNKYRHSRLWIAGQRVKPTGQEQTPFVWKVTSTGGRCTRTSQMAYTNWIPDEPNFRKNEEHCASVIREFSYQWNDDSCSLLFCAVCEIDLEDFD